MSEEVFLVLGVIFAIGIVGYLFLGVAGGSGLLSEKLSASQIAMYASNAGFVNNENGDLITAVAVALAESGGNPQAHGDTALGSGTGSFGLWQIYSDAHPEYGPDFTKLYDPQTNADAAFAIYEAAGNSFHPWSTFKGGQYLGYVSSASDAVNA